MTLRNNDTSSNDDREAALEADVARLRQALEGSVRRAADGGASSTADQVREVALARAEVALYQARAAKWEQAHADLTARHAVVVASEARYRLAVESEPPRVCRRPFGLGQAAKDWASA